MKKYRRTRTDYPQGVIGIYDNGGKSGDRYTVVYEPVETMGETWFQFVTMSATPYHPQGICLHAEDRRRPTGFGNPMTGKVIAFDDLPADCQRVVTDDLAEEAVV